MYSTAWRASTLAVLVAAAATAAHAEVRFSASANDRWCEDDGWDHRARHCEVREAAFSASGEIAVDARPNGGIEVRGWDRDEVRLRVKVVAAAADDGEARRLADQVRIETGDTIRAVGPEPRSRHRSWWVSFRLDVPRAAALQLEADNGGLSLRDVQGAARLQTVNGGIHLDRVGGNVHGQTVNGGVHLALSGTEWNGEGLDVRTTNGGLHIDVPAGYNARLSAGTVNGGVHSDIPPTSRGRSRGQRIETDLGHGGPLLKVETTNGGIHLNRH